MSDSKLEKGESKMKMGIGVGGSRPEVQRESRQLAARGPGEGA